MSLTLVEGVKLVVRKFSHESTGRPNDPVDESVVGKSSPPTILSMN
jgi:hypothetical protein